MNKNDVWTKYVKNSIDFLMVYNRINTAIGILIGTSLGFIIRVFKPLLTKGNQFVDVSYITSPLAFPAYIIFGVLLTNFPSLFKKRKLDPDVEDALAYIKEAQVNGKLSDQEIRALYRKLYSTVLSRLSSNNHESAKTET